MNARQHNQPISRSSTTLRTKYETEMIRTMRSPAVAVLTFLAATLTSGAASAQAYFGTWASQPAQCKVGQDQQNAPMIMRRDGYDQHETHCTFNSVRQKGSTWVARAVCSVEGDKQTTTLTLSVDNDRLTMRDERGARVLQRCR